MDLINQLVLAGSVMEELLLGSVTRHVLTHSSSDVLIAGHPG